MNNDLATNEIELETVASGLETEKQAEGVMINNAPKSDTSDLPNLNAVNAAGSLIGVRAMKWEEFVPLYKKHAATVGFNSKKATSRIEGGVVFEKYLVCSCAGKPPKPNENVKKRKRSDTKTECKAQLRIKLENGVYRVVEHEMVHNHPLTRLEWQHMHRAERSISKEKGEAMRAMDEAGVKPAVAYSYFVHTAGGEEHVGNTKTDHLNFVNRMRRKAIDGNDAQTLVNELLKKQREDPEFYFKLKLGDDGKLECVYWRDRKMKIDYLLYGDVVIFDTTYKTNRYDLICAPFVGVNNHWNTVMFACAFLNNETIDTFKWLFDQFLESMDQKKPATIFTDQDAAMASAIEQCFGKETKHRLCLWHLHKNATTNCGKLKKDKEFEKDFDHCLRGCIDRFEFEECWMNMINKFELRDHSWFKRLYGIKEKWCTALSKDFFSAGILSTQRSESTNNAISFKSTKHTSLTQFRVIFTETVERWRSKEKSNEFKCSWSTPRTSVPTGIMKHAAEVYTETIFRFVEVEFDTFLVSQAVVQVKIGLKTTYLVSLEDNPDPNKGALVIFSIANGQVEINCNCKHFEEVGWLCSHCLRVLFINNIKRIPDKYIKKRWRKDAKKDVWDKLGEEKQRKQGVDKIHWREYMCRRYCDLVIKSESNMDARMTLEDGYTRDSLAIEEIISNNDVETTNMTIQSTKESIAANQMVVQNPDRSTTKGRRTAQKKSFGRRKGAAANVTVDYPKKKTVI